VAEKNNANKSHDYSPWALRSLRIWSTNFVLPFL
jgi:hypothetical protein